MSNQFVRLCYEDDDFLYIQTKEQIKMIERFSYIGDKTLKTVENPVAGHYYLAYVGEDLLRIRHLSENESLLADFGEVSRKLVCLRKIGSNLNLSKPPQCYAVTKEGVSTNLDNRLEASAAAWSEGLVEVFVEIYAESKNVNEIEIVELTELEQKIPRIDNIKPNISSSTESDT